MGAPFVLHKREIAGFPARLRSREPQPRKMVRDRRIRPLDGGHGYANHAEAGRTGDRPLQASARAFLLDLFGAAVAAAHPDHCLVPHLPAPPAAGRLLILAAGKAAGAMAEVAERHYVDDCGLAAARIGGLAVTRHGYGRPTRFVRADRGRPSGPRCGRACGDIGDACAGRRAPVPADLVLVLISGGASANWIAPAAGLTLGEKQAVTRALLASGASISEINTVRKHLSRIKGGRLAEHAAPARLVAVGISDVPGDDPAVIGSGPTVAGPDHARGRARDRGAPSSGRLRCA